jgi:hypothetical protein
VDPRAKAALERSQQTTATYSLFAWNDVPDGRDIKDGWSAEFHRANLHRVETPSVRIIANCKEMTGTRLLVATGEKLSDRSVAKAACGINGNFDMHSVEWLDGSKPHLEMLIASESQPRTLFEPMMCWTMEHWRRRFMPGIMGNNW